MKYSLSRSNIIVSLILLMPFTIIQIGCVNQEEKIINCDHITTVDNIAYNKLDMSIVNGKVCKWYNNGQLEDEAMYKEGKIIGIRKGWHSNGRLFYEWSYKNGKADGMWKYYAEDDDYLTLEIPYKDNKRNGVMRFYHKGGAIKKEIIYRMGKQISD